MTVTARVSSMAQVPAAAAAVLGFTPRDSLVVLGLGGGPSARVDAGEGLEAPLVALQSAAPHWEASAPLVVLFGTSHGLSALVDMWADTMPGVTVRDFLKCDHNSITSWNTGQTVPVDAAGLDPTLTAIRVEDSREALENDAARIDDAGEAWRMAVASYLAGAGARAWVYLDRYVALGEADTRAAILSTLLTQAVDPKSEGLEDRLTAL